MDLQTRLPPATEPPTGPNARIYLAQRKNYLAGAEL